MHANSSRWGDDLYVTLLADEGLMNCRLAEGGGMNYMLTENDGVLNLMLAEADEVLNSMLAEGLMIYILAEGL